MLSRLVILFLPRSKHLLISWLQSPSAMIFEPNKIRSVTVYIFSPDFCNEVMGPDAIILVFWTLSFKPAFSLSSFTFIKRLLTRAFAICLWGDWTLCCCSYQQDLQHHPRGIQGRDWGTLSSRESGRTGLSIVRYFQELISWSQSLYLFMSRESLNPFIVTSAPHD